MDLKLPFVLILTCFAVRLHIADAAKKKKKGQPPKEVPWHGWTQIVSNVHFTNMTAELVKDAIIKMNIVRNLMKRYKSGSMYKLGEISANAKDMFLKMVQIYKDTSRLDTFRISNKKATLAYEIHVAGGFAMAQSFYHRIRLEKKLFDAIIREDSKKTQVKMKIFQAQYGAIPPEWGMVEPLKGGIFNRRRIMDNDELPSYAVKIPDLNFNWEMAQNLSEQPHENTKNIKQQLTLENQPDVRTPDVKTLSIRTPPSGINTNLWPKNKPKVESKLQPIINERTPPFSGRNYDKGFQLSYKSGASRIKVPAVKDGNRNRVPIMSRSRPASLPVPPTRRIKKPIWRPKISN